MAKVTLIAVFCMLCGTLIEGIRFTQEDVKNFLKKLDECKVETKASPDDVDKLLRKLPSVSMEGHCLRTCIMKKYEVMNNDGKFVKSVSFQFAEKFTDGNEKEMNCATQMINACTDIKVPDDHCLASHAYYKCLKSQGKICGFENFAF